MGAKTSARRRTRIRVYGSILRVSDGVARCELLCAQFLPVGRFLRSLLPILDPSLGGLGGARVGIPGVVTGVMG